MRSKSVFQFITVHLVANEPSGFRYSPQSTIKTQTARDTINFYRYAMGSDWILGIDSALTRLNQESQLYVLFLPDVRIETSFTR